MLANEIAQALLNNSDDLVRPGLMAGLMQDTQRLWEEAHKNEFTYRRVCQILDAYFQDLMKDCI